MFLKQYRVKSSERMKSSDVKRLRQRIEKDFPNGNTELILSAKSTVQHLKIVTHGEFQTHVFSVDKLPMFFEIEENRLVPTLYAMWAEPKLLPCFTTWEAVLPKLSNGADLMLPGVIPQGTGMNMYGHFKKGQLVAVNLTSNSAAVGVGYLGRSSDDLYMCGGQGVAVKMLHLFGDKLWGHEPSLSQQLPLFKTAKLTDDDFPALGAEIKKSSKPKEQQTAVESQRPAKTSDDIAVNEELLKIDDLEISVCDKRTTENETARNAESSVTRETILKNAFLSALKNHGRKLQLPLLTSNFYRLYIVPEATEQIDLKKTKYKKLSNFLTEMIDQGFIVVREEAKGVDKITSIDFEHPELVNFITDIKHSGAQNVGKEGNGPEQPLFHSELTELYIVSDETAAFFTKLNYKRGEGIPVAQVKKIIREYINKLNLPMVDPVSKKISLDETLQAVCESDAATLSEICTAVTNKMEHSFQMCSGKDTSANKPLIQMSLATRSGNKKVTLVSNVDCYGIILSEFIKLCKQGAAASTTIVRLPNQKRDQLQIQGNQIRFIYNLLTETYKVPGKCILGLELAKDGKKHKKK